MLEQFELSLLNQEREALREESVLSRRLTMQVVFPDGDTLPTLTEEIFRYDSLGRLIFWGRDSYGKGLTLSDTYRYNELGQLVSIHHDAGSRITCDSFLYDVMGRLEHKLQSNTCSSPSPEWSELLFEYGDGGSLLQISWLSTDHTLVGKWSVYHSAEGDTIIASSLMNHSKTIQYSANGILTIEDSGDSCKYEFVFDGSKLFEKRTLVHESPKEAQSFTYNSKGILTSSLRKQYFPRPNSIIYTYHYP